MRSAIRPTLCRIRRADGGRAPDPGRRTYAVKRRALRRRAARRRQLRPGQQPQAGGRGRGRQGPPQRRAEREVARHALVAGALRDPLAGRRGQPHAAHEGRRPAQRRAARPPRHRQAVGHGRPRHPVGRLGSGAQQLPAARRPRRRAGQRLAVPQPRPQHRQGRLRDRLRLGLLRQGHDRLRPRDRHRPHPHERRVQDEELRADPPLLRPRREQAGPVPLADRQAGRRHRAASASAPAPRRAPALSRI